MRIERWAVKLRYDEGATPGRPDDTLSSRIRSDRRQRRSFTREVAETAAGLGHGARLAVLRGTARVLSDLARDELVALARLISGLRRAQLETGRDWLTVTVTRRDDAPAPLVSIEPIEPEGQRIDIVESVHARRLFGLLKSNQLADDASSGYADSIVGPDVMVIGRKMLAHLSELLLGVSTA